MKLKPTDQFLLLWRHLDGPELTPEFRFDPSRRWRADYAHLPSKTLIEIEGGIYVRGRHVRPQGYTNDAVKYNRAGMLGYTVLRLTPEMIDEDTLTSIIQRCQAATLRA